MGNKGSLDNSYLNIVNEKEWAMVLYSTRGLTRTFQQPFHILWRTKKDEFKYYEHTKKLNI